MTIEINLLPWREEVRARRSKRFYLALALMALIGLGGGYGMTWYYEQRLSAQQERNEFVEAESRRLDAAIREISELEEIRQTMEAQVRVFTELQAGRAQTVHVFNDLVTSLVDGVHYTRLNRQGDNLQMAGVAENNRQVSDQLRALAAAASLTEPVLSEVEAEQEGELRHFSLSLGQRMPSASDDASGGQP
ncbi:PilN domain-containing protein [Halomonas sp. CKK8]|uniref:PilN domain-containing protein n=1 Tax=Halomonas sp. CKK8 TaxID=3036127 RepID=UPI0024150BA3|nr:PilN domain-containing protein [Halomonas sp. CKK8]WFM70818.1 PilN domain-containing protein [Halomonas sp. CKK8]